MSFWTDLRMPREQELLIGFYDLSGYMRYAEHTEPQRLLDVMAGYFALTGQIVRDAGGRLIKTLGDAGLAAFPPNRPTRPSAPFRRCGGRAAIGSPSTTTRASHRQTASWPGRDRQGRQSGRGDHRCLRQDGECRGDAAQHRPRLTPAVFRSLQPETRKLFKKHTPPISYINPDDRRPA